MDTSTQAPGSTMEQGGAPPGKLLSMAFSMATDSRIREMAMAQEDAYLSSMIESFPLSQRAKEPGKTLKGETSLKYLRNFSYGDYLQAQYNDERCSSWLYHILSGKLSKKQEELLLSCVSAGCNRDNLTEIAKHLGELSEDKQGSVSDILQWIKDNYSVRIPRKEWGEMLEKRMEQFLDETDRIHIPCHISGEQPTVSDSFLFTPEKASSKSFLASAERHWVSLGNDQDLLLHFMAERIDQERVASITEFLSDCHFILEDTGSPTVTLGDHSFSTDSLTLMLSNLLEEVFSRRGGGYSVNASEWPGDTLLTMSSLGNRLNFFSLSYYGEMGREYNEEWANAAFDWSSMGTLDTCLNRLGKLPLQEEILFEDELSRLHYITQGR